MTESKSESAAEPRAIFAQACSDGDYYAARKAGRSLMSENAHGNVLRFLAKTIVEHHDGISPLARKKVAVLSSYSFEFIKDALIVESFLAGVFADIYQPGFNQFRQEILNPGSAMYDFEPDVIIISALGENVVPALYDGSVPGDRTEAGDAVIAELKDLFATLREKTSAPVLIQNFAPLEYPSLGVGDALKDTGQRYAIQHLNHQLARLADSFNGVYPVDYEGIVFRHGALNWHDKRMGYYAQAPIEKGMYLPLAREFAKILRILSGGTKKCIVVDLDNTLWGGILGEDGQNGIKLGTTYPGNAFKAFQRELLVLHDRGILLAIASKNNMADVEQVFADHAHMVLSLEHFVSKQIHWGPKSESLRTIAETLNIGLDHVVFVDDNPVECEEVASALPMVEVINFPKKVEHYQHALYAGGYFDVLETSAEDQKRAALYKQRAQAEELRSSARSIEDFYSNLDMIIRFEAMNGANVKRIAQLTQKTNQFNATTRRYSVSDLEEFDAQGNYGIYAVSVEDKFGDNGIVGVIITRETPDNVLLDTFLLSCRVIGRTVEAAMLAFVCRRMESGPNVLKGEIIPTPKNVPVRSLYEQNGFERVAADQAGSQWRLNVADNPITYPSWFKVDDRTVSAIED